MGVFVELRVNFNAVQDNQWADVYEESLTLLQSYPFMDKIVDETSYANQWIYADQSHERYLSPWMPEEKGWYTIGDMVTQQHAEDFMLLRDYAYYLKKSSHKTEESGDVLVTLPSLYTVDFELPAVPSQTLCFCGRRYHQSADRSVPGMG